MRVTIGANQRYAASPSPLESLIAKEWEEVMAEVEALPSTVQTVVVRHLVQRQCISVPAGKPEKFVLDGVGLIRRTLVERINEYLS